MSYTNRSNGEKSYSRDAPVIEGNEYEAEITEISRRGDGIAKIKGFIVFVSGAKVGDHIKFRVTKVARRYATAEILQ